MYNGIPGPPPGGMMAPMASKLFVRNALSVCILLTMLPLSSYHSATTATTLGAEARYLRGKLGL